ncbi:MAG: hypothetical protein P8130_09110 [Deltaproteobacteria bacterium]
MKKKKYNRAEQRQFDSKLLPVLEEGVQMVKLITFRELQKILRGRYSEQDERGINFLAGALINEIFLTPNTDGPFMQFHRQHQSLINQEIRRLGDSLQKLKPLLTDAVRIQFLIDSQHGADNRALLEQAKALGVLELEREVPMPAKFIHLVRLVGQAQGLLTPDSPKSE